MYSEGEGVTRDNLAAGKLYRLAAQQGYAPAQHNLNIMYDQGLIDTEHESVVEPQPHAKVKTPTLGLRESARELCEGVTAIAGGLTFFGFWIYMITKLGLVWGLLFGWIPSTIVALFAALLWPMVLLLLALFIAVTLFPARL